MTPYSAYCSGSDASGCNSCESRVIEYRRLQIRATHLVQDGKTAAVLAHAAQFFGQEDDISVIVVSRTAVLEPAAASMLRERQRRTRTPQRVSCRLPASESALNVARDPLIQRVCKILWDTSLAGQ
jgi:hypothetical protein